MLTHVPLRPSPRSCFEGEEGCDFPSPNSGCLLWKNEMCMERMCQYTDDSSLHYVERMIKEHPKHAMDFVRSRSLEQLSYVAYANLKREL